MTLTLNRYLSRVFFYGHIEPEGFTRATDLSGLDEHVMYVHYYSYDIFSTYVMIFINND